MGATSRPRTEFAPFLDYDTEIRRVIYSTDAIESLHARMRRATRARGHVPNEQAALNAFAITFEGRLHRRSVINGRPVTPRT